MLLNLFLVTVIYFAIQSFATCSYWINDDFWPKNCGKRAQVTVEQTCFCSRTTRQLPCSLENSPAERFECGDVCQRTLDCGEHHCQRPCHAGQCDPCPLKVDTVLTCPCGKVPLEQLYQRKNKPAPPKRTKCTDPVPTCGQTCGKGPIFPPLLHSVSGVILNLMLTWLHWYLYQYCSRLRLDLCSSLLVVFLFAQAAKTWLSSWDWNPYNVYDQWFGGHI